MSQRLRFDAASRDVVQVTSEDDDELMLESEDSIQNILGMGPLSLSFVYHGVYSAGARDIMPCESDLKYEFFAQDIYLIRGVSLHELPEPEHSRPEALAFSLIAHGQARWGQLERLVQMLPSDASHRWRQEHDSMHPSPRRFTAGAWNRGPHAGVNRFARAFPWTTRALAGIVATWDSALQFSTCTLSLNTSAAPHRDSFNHRESMNLAMPVSRFTGGEVFVEDPAGRSRLSADGPAGHILDLQFPVTFSPRSLHATLPWTGSRLILIAFHIGQSHRLHEHEVEQLQGMGFRIGFTSSA